MAISKWRATAGQAEAMLIEMRLVDHEAPSSLAVTRFESGAGRWTVEAYYDGAEATLEGIGAALSGIEHDGPASLEPVDEEDWVARVEAELAPVVAGRFVVHGPHDRARVAGHPLAIEIEAGGAFGTAHHATTQGCLEALSGLLWQRRRGAVLDLGTGSGVLAIAAARASGRAGILATDIDPLAVAIARDNCRKNGVGHLIEVLEADGLEHPRLSGAAAFDLVVANILAEPLIAIAPGIARALAPGGDLVLSGILEDQAASVRAAFEQAGLVHQHTIDMPQWPTLVMARR